MDGIRTEKVVGGVTHSYITQNSKVMRETIGTGSTAKVLDFIYDNQGRPLALKYSTNGGSSFNTYYYVLNYQGDVVKLIHYIPGFEYVEKASYSYDAWGKLISSSGELADVNPLRYRGYYYDTETGFYYLQSRYYDPIVRRFLNADSFASTGQGFLGTNMFAYCQSNPVTYSDPTGHAIWPCTANYCDGGTRPEADRIVGAGTELSLYSYGDTMIIDAYITFSGEIDQDILINGIKSYWNGTYLIDRKEVIVVVDVHLGTAANGESIVVDSIKGNGRSFTFPELLSAFPYSRVTVYSHYEHGGAKNIGWSMAHEFGHCLGIEDYYTHEGEKKFKKSFPSIMNRIGFHAINEDIAMVLAAFYTGKYQYWEEFK